MQTAARGEVFAILMAVRMAVPPLHIFCDNTYAVNSCADLKAAIRDPKGRHVDLWRKIYEAISGWPRGSVLVSWIPGRYWELKAKDKFRVRKQYF